MRALSTSTSSLTRPTFARSKASARGRAMRSSRPTSATAAAWIQRLPSTLPMRWFTWRPKAMSTVRSRGRMPSSAPTCLERTLCSKRHGATGCAFRPERRPPSVSCMPRLMRFTARSAWMESSLNRPPTSRRRPTRLRKPVPIIWSVPGSARSDCPPSFPTARTTTGRIIFPKN